MGPVRVFRCLSRKGLTIRCSHFPLVLPLPGCWYASVSLRWWVLQRSDTRLAKRSTSGHKDAQGARSTCQRQRRPVFREIPTSGEECSSCSTKSMASRSEKAFQSPSQATTRNLNTSCLRFQSVAFAFISPSTTASQFISPSDLSTLFSPCYSISPTLSW